MDDFAIVHHSSAVEGHSSLDNPYPSWGEGFINFIDFMTTTLQQKHLKNKSGLIVSIVHLHTLPARCLHLFKTNLITKHYLTITNFFWKNKC